MAEYEIIPIKNGEFQNQEKSTLTYLHGFGEKIKSPIIVYLIRGAGLNILVDTGCSGEEWAKKYHHPIKQTEDMKLLKGLERLGLKPENIDCIINTHLHWDHCWNNNLFPGKKIYVQKKELEFAENPLPTQYIYYESEKIGMIPPFKKVMDQYELVDGDITIYKGIELIFIPGHTPGFQGVLIDTIEGKYLIAGDCLGCFENWNGAGIQKHVPSAIHVDLNQCYSTYKKIEKICDYILPGHDMKVFEHDVYPPNM